jgi:hypothetical protein
MIWTKRGQSFLTLNRTPLHASEYWIFFNLNCLQLILLSNFASSTAKKLYSSSSIHFVSKNEQLTYDREGIEWSYIEFPENQDVLDLVDKKCGSGIISILDDQCRAPSTSNKSFVLAKQSSSLWLEIIQENSLLQCSWPIMGRCRDLRFLG